MHTNILSTDTVHFVTAALNGLYLDKKISTTNISYLQDGFYRLKTLKSITCAHENGAPFILGLKPEYIQRYKENPLFNAKNSISSVSNLFSVAMKSCPANLAFLFFQEKNDFTWFFNLTHDQQADFIKTTERADPRYFSIESSLLEKMDKIIHHFQFAIELANDNVKESTIKHIMDDTQITMALFEPFITKREEVRRYKQEKMFLELQKFFAKTQYFKDSLSAYGVDREDTDMKIQILHYIKSECEENIGTFEYQTLFRFLRKEIKNYSEHGEWDANLYALGKLFLPNNISFDKIIDKWHNKNNINKR